MDTKSIKNWSLTVAVLVIVTALWYLVQHYSAPLAGFTPAAVRDYIKGYGKLAAGVYVLAYALNTVTMLPPIAVMSLTAGLAFGKIEGACLLMAGALIGSSTTFLISRSFGRAFVERRLSGKFKDLDDNLEKKGFGTILFFRLIPLVPYEILNYAGGFSKIKFRDYFFATALGLIPGVTVSAYFGGELGEVRKLRDLLTVPFIAALLVLIAAISVPVVYMHFKKRNGGNA